MSPALSRLLPLILAAAVGAFLSVLVMTATGRTGPLQGVCVGLRDADGGTYVVDTTRARLEDGVAVCDVGHFVSTQPAG